MFQPGDDVRRLALRQLLDLVREARFTRRRHRCVWVNERRRTHAPALGDEGLLVSGRRELSPPRRPE